MNEINLSVEENEAIVARTPSCRCFCGKSVIKKDKSWTLVDPIEKVTHGLLGCSALVSESTPHNNCWHESNHTVTYMWLKRERWAFTVCNVCHNVLGGRKVEPDKNLFSNG